ncbi:MAG: N-acetyl-gamma-glutamyl-phosphate reductase, partial [Oligoflexales bacterium]|nr:N-acetyl-gamma-glutamyl-phosphate reductase [Oligoflexales bacterium]
MEKFCRKIKTAVVGASGYTGGELLKLLLMHPNMELSFASSSEYSGQHVSDCHPNLYKLTDLKFEKHTNGDGKVVLPKGTECVFFATPHGMSMKLLPSIPRGVKVIDLGADYRISSEGRFEKYYSMKHTDFIRQKSFIYGLTEVFSDEIRKAEYVSNPGCFATAVQLSLYPLLKKRLIKGKIIIDAKTGSSGSGVNPSATTHHPFRSSSFCAYKPFVHQHMAEIEQLIDYCGSDIIDDVLFQAHSAPMVRGIFSTIYCELDQDISDERLRDVFLEFYRDSCFVRLVKGSPNSAFVKNTNFIDIGFAISGKNLVVYAALDNLLKGASGQAVQNMNLMFG